MASTDTKPEDKTGPTAEQKPEEKEKTAVALGEDDEFEDFPVDGTHIPPCGVYLSPAIRGNHGCSYYGPPQQSTTIN